MIQAGLHNTPNHPAPPLSGNSAGAVPADQQLNAGAACLCVWMGEAEESVGEVLGVGGGESVGLMIGTLHESTPHNPPTTAGIMKVSLHKGILIPPAPAPRPPAASAPHQPAHPHACLLRSPLHLDPSPAPPPSPQTPSSTQPSASLRSARTRSGRSPPAWPTHPPTSQRSAPSARSRSAPSARSAQRAAGG